MTEEEFMDRVALIVFLLSLRVAKILCGSLIGVRGCGLESPAQAASSQSVEQEEALPGQAPR